MAHESKVVAVALGLALGAASATAHAQQVAASSSPSGAPSGLNCAPSTASGQHGAQGTSSGQYRPQSTPSAAGNPSYSSPNATRGGPGTGVGGVGESSILAAPVPQYWLTDAAIFLGNSAHTAVLMSREPGISVQAPSILGSQAMFLVNSTTRALSDMNGLLENAMATNPEAVPTIHSAMAQLFAAQAEAQEVANTASQGLLGPPYEVALRSTLGHLNAAQAQLGHIARAYQVEARTLGLGGFSNVAANRAPSAGPSTGAPAVSGGGVNTGAGPVTTPAPGTGTTPRVRQ